MASSTIAKRSGVIIDSNSTVDVTCSANTVVTAQVTIPAKSGYQVRMLDAWADTTGTTGATNATMMIPVNHWGDNGSADSARTANIVYRNMASSSSKFTANISFIYYR